MVVRYYFDRCRVCSCLGHLFIELQLNACDDDGNDDDDSDGDEVPLSAADYARL